MVKARKTMRHMKKKGKYGKKAAPKVGKSARRRTVKKHRRTRRRMKLRGGNGIQGQLDALREKVTNVQKEAEALKNKTFSCRANN